MTRSITIRNVPDEVGDKLASRAAASGRSLQEYLLAHLVDLVDRPDPEVWVTRVRERKKQTASTLSSKAILAHRDANRR